MIYHSSKGISAIISMSSSSSQTASPPEVVDNGEGSSRQPNNPPVVTVSTPVETKAEKKKRVGFASHPSPPREEDYFSHTPINSSQNNTPALDGAPPDPPSRRDSFDRAELTEALEKILKPEDHSSPQVAAAIAANLRLPRPVLRKTVYPDSPAEPIAGRAHPSEIEARNRAGRLAESVSRTSIESHDGLLDGSAIDVYDHAAATGSSSSPPDEDSEAQLTYRRRAETDADRLVRRHTKRRAREGLEGLGSASAMSLMGTQTPDAGTRSGTATPVAYDLEYVPAPPPKYHGGILGTLLKLYSAEEAARSGGGSGQTTPDGFRTPNRTPNRTPRSSPPSTAPGTPRVPDGPPSRPRSGLFGLGSRHSSSTLAELIGSSSTLAAPAASSSAGKDWSDMVSDKLKREREKPKKEHKRKSSKTQKAQELLITKQ